MVICVCSFSFWRRSNYFLRSWTVTVFDPGGINIFFDIQFLPLCGLPCLHLYPEWNIQPLWKVKGLEQYTSLKVRVPDFFMRNEQNLWHGHVHVRVRVSLCFFVVWCSVMSCVARRCWLGGWVWCGAVDMSLSWWSLSSCRGPSHCVVIEK